VTVTVRFKADAGSTGRIYLGDDLSDQAAMSPVAGNGAWQTLTLTLTMRSNDALSVCLYSDGSTLYDNLQASSTLRGTVASAGDFATLVQSPYANNWKLAAQGQWMFYGTPQQTAGVNAGDAGTDAQLKTFVDNMPSVWKDRITRTVYDAAGRAT